MTEAGSLLAAASAFAVVAASPGPANLAVATTAMARGRGPAMRLGAGLALGLSAWGVAAAAGLGALLAASASALVALKVVGALYLGWLAISSARAAAAPAPEAPAGAAPSARWALRGLALNLANPKAAMAWLAVLAVGLPAGSGPGAVVVVTAVCAAIGALNYAAWGLLFSMGGAMRAYARLRRWVEGAAAALFGAAALGLARSAAAR